METTSVELGPGRLRAIQRALCDVAATLAARHGQRQFYGLAQVRAAAAGVAVDWQPWVFAVFVARADFEAWFAVRETPGSYEQLRAALSAPRPEVVDEWAAPDGIDPSNIDDVVALAWVAIRLTLG